MWLTGTVPIGQCQSRKTYDECINSQSKHVLQQIFQVKMNSIFLRK